MALAPASWAHPPNESTAEFHWVHGRLELEAVLPLAMANALLGDAAPQGGLTAENFSAARARLLAEFSAGLVITNAAAARDAENAAPGDESKESAASRALRPASAEATFDATQEVVCRLTYAVAPPTALDFDARFLEHAQKGAYCLYRVWAGADDLLTQELLRHGVTQTTIPTPPGAP